MKKLMLVTAIVLSGNVFADYGYSHQSDAYSHQQAEQIKDANNLNSDTNSTTSNPSNYHRNEGYGMTSVD